VGGDDRLYVEKKNADADGRDECRGWKREY